MQQRPRKCNQDNTRVNFNRVQPSQFFRFWSSLPSRLDATPTPSFVVFYQETIYGCTYMLKFSDLNFVGLWEAQEQRFVSENTRIKKRFAKGQGHWRYTLGVKCTEPRFCGTKPRDFHGRFGAQKAQWAYGMNARSPCSDGAANVSALGVSERKKEKDAFITHLFVVIIVTFIRYFYAADSTLNVVADHQYSCCEQLGYYRYTYSPNDLVWPRDFSYFSWHDVIGRRKYPVRSRISYSFIRQCLRFGLYARVYCTPDEICVLPCYDKLFTRF